MRGHRSWFGFTFGDKLETWMHLECSETKQKPKPHMDWVERICAVGWDVTPTGCWEWRGYRGVRGRARVDWRGVRRYAYRITYEAVYGPIPEGLVACHLCDNPTCINPDHIKPGTQQENIDMMPQPGALKVTPDMAQAIRADYIDTDMTQAAIAAKYGVSKRSVGRTVSGIYRRQPRKVA
jgi:hypothetical protein